MSAISDQDNSVGSHQSGCIIIGVGVPMPDKNNVIRVGNAKTFLEILSDGTARIVGEATPDETANAVLDAIAMALASVTIERRMATYYAELSKRMMPTCSICGAYKPPGQRCDH